MRNMFIVLHRRQHHDACAHVRKVGRCICAAHQCLPESCHTYTLHIACSASIDEWSVTIIYPFPCRPLNVPAGGIVIVCAIGIAEVWPRPPGFWPGSVAQPDRRHVC
jgi:hypothetical protein